MKKYNSIIFLAALTALPLATLAPAQTILALKNVGGVGGTSLVSMSPDGSNNTTLATSIGNSDLIRDSSGRLYISDLSSSTIRRYGADGTLDTGFTAISLSSPRGMAFDTSGNLFAISNGEVRKYDSSGSFLGTFALIGSDARALAFNSSGDLLVANGNVGTVQRFSSGGSDLGVFATLPAGNIAIDLLFTPSGTLLVAGYRSVNGGVRQFAGNGSDLGNFATFNYITGISLASDGHLFATTQTSFGNPGKIEEFGASGSYLASIATGATLQFSGIAYVSAIPEPSTYAAIFGASALGLAAWRRKRATVKGAA